MIYTARVREGRKRQRKEWEESKVLWLNSVVNPVLCMHTTRQEYKKILYAYYMLLLSVLLTFSYLKNFHRGKNRILFVTYTWKVLFITKK